MMGHYWLARWHLSSSSSSVGVCNTPQLACRRLEPRRPGDDAMPSNYNSMVTLHAGQYGYYIPLVRQLFLFFCHPIVFSEVLGFRAVNPPVHEFVLFGS